MYHLPGALGNSAVAFGDVVGQIGLWIGVCRPFFGATSIGWLMSETQKAGGPVAMGGFSLGNLDDEFTRRYHANAGFEDALRRKFFSSASDAGGGAEIRGMYNRREEFDGNGAA